MGGKLSGILANIYMSQIESEIIIPLLQNKKIEYYRRYVDDCIIVANKNIIDETFKNLNNHAKTLKFTIENMENNSLNFLDCNVYYDSETRQFEFKNYQKITKSNVLINYKKSIIPQKYKLSCLSGEIFRMKHTSSTEKNLTNSLKNLKTKFLLNEYPENIIDEKINFIKNKKFQSNQNKETFAKEKTENPERNHTFCIPYSNMGVEHITKLIQKAIKKTTPNFKVNFAFSTPKISSFLLPSIKPTLTDLERSAVVYKFTCPCGASYIGETTRVLKYRINEHNQKSRPSEIHAHIIQCEIYQNNLPTHIDSKKTTYNFHLHSLFEIISKNQYRYLSRINTESILITLLEPSLNKQNSFKKLTVF